MARRLFLPTHMQSNHRSLGARDAHFPYRNRDRLRAQSWRFGDWFDDQLRLTGTIVETAAGNGSASVTAAVMLSPVSLASSATSRCASSFFMFSPIVLYPSN